MTTDEDKLAMSLVRVCESAGRAWYLGADLGDSGNFYDIQSSLLQRQKSTKARYIVIEVLAPKPESGNHECSVE